MLKSAIENAFINRLLQHVLDGDKGSNLLGAVLVALLAGNIDWVKALQGFKFNNQDEAMESAKVAGIVVVAVFSWFVGKGKPAAAK